MNSTDATKAVAAQAALEERLRRVHTLLAEAWKQQGTYAGPAHAAMSCVLPALEELAGCVALLAAPPPAADAGPRFLGRDAE